MKNILPTLGNEFISLIKETSVVSFVGAADLYVAFNYIGSNSYEFMVPYLVMAPDLYCAGAADLPADQNTGKEPEEE